MLAQRPDGGPSLHQHWANVLCYLGSGMRRVERHPIAILDNTGQSPNAVPMLGQRRRLWVNIETALGECHVFADVLAQVYNRPSVGLVLGQRHRQLTGIKPAKG